MATSYLVVANGRPGVIQTLNPTRQMLLAASIAAATGYTYLQTQSPCYQGGPVPSDAVPFPGFVDAAMTSTGAVAVTGSSSAAPIPLKGDKGDPGPKGDPGGQGIPGNQGPKGDPAVLPAGMGGIATTNSSGKAVLDWSALKLTAPPSSWSIAPIGKPMPWAFDAAPTPTGVTVSVQAEKPTAVVNVSVDAAGGQPAVGVPVAWHVSA